MLWALRNQEEDPDAFHFGKLSHAFAFVAIPAQPPPSRWKVETYHLSLMYHTRTMKIEWLRPTDFECDAFDVQDACRLVRVILKGLALFLFHPLLFNFPMIFEITKESRIVAEGRSLLTLENPLSPTRRIPRLWRLDCKEEQVRNILYAQIKNATKKGEEGGYTLAKPWKVANLRKLIRW